MQYTDESILQLFKRKDGGTNGYLCGWNILKNRDIDAYNYLKNRYNDIDDNDKVSEILYRIKNKIDVRPKCLVCGTTHNMFKGIGYRFFCSLKCQHSEEGNKHVQQQFQKTFLERYGVTNPLKSEKIKNKIYNTNIKRYGGKSPLSNEDIKKKAQETCLKKYGVSLYSKSDECKEKYKQTCLKKYGVDNLIKLKETQDKIKKTCFRKYGVSSYLKTKDFKEKVLKTMKENGTLPHSKIEVNFYNYLLTIFKEDDIIQQYKNELYPYHCDFYIKSIDVYIEINGTWTHGLHPFDETNNEDIQKLNYWKSKNSPYYNSAIKTWTKLDVSKRKIARQNKLLFLEIYSIKIDICKQEFLNFLKAHNITI